MKKIFLIISILTLIISGSVDAQDYRATTDEGRSVVLKKTGTWFFVDRSPLQEGRAVIFNGRAVKLEKNGTWAFMNNKEPAPVPRHVYSKVTATASFGRSYTGINYHPFLASNAVELATKDGSRADPSRVTTKALVLVYFSAHWCGPCRNFTPDLVQFYNQKGGGSKFELIFVSDDYDGLAMMEYMRAMDMPWIGVRWESSGAKAIEQKYSGTGIPCLVLLNANDEVLSHSYVGGQYVGPDEVLKDLENMLRQ